MNLNVVLESQNISDIVLTVTANETKKTKRIKVSRNSTLADYFEHWIDVNKKGRIKQVTLEKYYNTLRHLRKINNTLKLSEINKSSLQDIIDAFAETHAKRTTSTFIESIYSAITDAYDDELIDRLPSKKIINRGQGTNRHTQKFLHNDELQKLFSVMKLEGKMNMDYFMIFLAKTGLRFAEALAVTKADINLQKRMLIVNKSYNYKRKDGKGIFIDTKTHNSVREILLDWHLVAIMTPIIERLQPNQLLFGELISESGIVYNSTFTSHLKRLCKKADVPIITIHGLRHTHASILIADGISMPSISKRLGHASPDITQKVYIHLIRELEHKDNTKITQSLSGIC